MIVYCMFEYFAKGKRSTVYKGEFEGKEVILKKETRNLRRIKNEAFWLKKLNGYGIGPKLLKEKDDYFICEFVKGKPLREWITTADKNNIKKVLMEVLRQLRIMDDLKVNKCEMTRPYKHVIVYKNKPVMIDFEKCKFSLKPKNVSQFFQFVINVLKLDRDEVLIALKEYCKDYSDESFKGLIKKIKEKEFIKLTKKV